MSYQGHPFLNYKPHEIELFCYSIKEYWKYVYDNALTLIFIWTIRCFSNDFFNNILQIKTQLHKYFLTPIVVFMVASKVYCSFLSIWCFISLRKL